MRLQLPQHSSAFEAWTASNLPGALMARRPSLTPHVSNQVHSLTVANT